MIKRSIFPVGGEPPAYPGDLKIMSQGSGVRLLQELLVLQEFPVLVDGVMGKGTLGALQAFAKKSKQLMDECLNNGVWTYLILPMLNCLVELPQAKSLEATALSYAQRHLNAGAREIPPNTGPWVRLYCGGKDGRPYAWCAGFVSFCIRQAAIVHKVRGVPNSLSSTVIANWGKRQGLLVSDAFGIAPGALFVVPGKRGYVHIGFVKEQLGRSIVTIEGNSNEAGSAEGIKVIERVRLLSTVDVIMGYSPEGK